MILSSSYIVIQKSDFEFLSFEIDHVMLVHLHDWVLFEGRQFEFELDLLYLSIFVELFGDYVVRVIVQRLLLHLL